VQSTLKFKVKKGKSKRLKKSRILEQNYFQEQTARQTGHLEIGLKSMFDKDKSLKNAENQELQENQPDLEKNLENNMEPKDRWAE